MRRIRNFLKTLEVTDEDIQTLPVVGTLANLVDDTTPQLGGPLDLNAKPITEILTAGENLSAGDLCYLKSDGKFWKANASAQSTAAGMFALANASINANANGEFILMGRFTTSELITGSIYFIDTLAGQITETKPSSSGQIVRIIGYALSATVLFFNPDQTFIEIS